MFLSRLSLSLFFFNILSPAGFRRRPDSRASDSLGENRHFDISHPENAQAHGITTKHCSLLLWQLMTRIQPFCAGFSQDCTQMGLSNIKMLGSMKAERQRFSFFCLFYPMPLCLLVLTLNRIIKCSYCFRFYKVWLFWREASLLLRDWSGKSLQKF